jgi:hypothetical protein
MVWLHPALLLGLALTALPVLLHLLMKAKPKRLVFPALRLIQNRKRTNVRRLRLRHISLLLLRIAVISLIVLAVARPTLPAADYSFSAGDWLRLLAVVGAVTVGYFGAMRFWRSQRLAAHELAYRRSYLRAGLAIAGLLALLSIVAWPYQRRIAAAITQPTLAPSEFLPVAAVMLFDTSLSMQYRHENRTRLEVAQEVANKHLGGLPRSSRVAICESTGDAAVRFQSDLGGAAKRIALLTPQPLSRPLDERLLAALDAHFDDQGRESTAAERQASDLVREIYVFTDLAASAWRPDDSPRLREMLQQAANVSVYLIDVGVAAPSNLALTELMLSEQSVPRGNVVSLQAALEATGTQTGERVVELHLENESGKLVKKEQQTFSVDPATSTTVSFPVRGLGGPVLQGELRLLGSDPLQFDDVRYFSLLVQPPADVLVVADSRSEALYLTNVLSPDELQALGRLRYRTRLLPTDKLATADLSRYSAVCLMNAAAPSKAAWDALHDYVAGGGSLLVVLGDRVVQKEYLTPAAQQVLPAEPAKILTFDRDEYLDLGQSNHPLFRKFAEWGTTGLTATPILRCWSVNPAERDTAVVATYTDARHRPAFIERAIARGRVLMLTTSLDRRWNELPVSEWFVVLADQMLQYLSQRGGAAFNFVIGEPVTIPLDPSVAAPAYLLRKPGLQQLRNEIQPGTTVYHVQDVDQLGSYRLSSVDSPNRFERGFSVNAPAGESRLDRLTKDQLDARLGENRYSLAKGIDTLERNVRTGRLGREAFPFLGFLLLIAFLGEHLLANRFYQNESAAAGESAAKAS